MAYAALLAAGGSVQHHEQVILTKMIRLSRFFQRRVRDLNTKQSSLRWRGGGGGPLAGRAAEVRGQRTGRVLGHHGSQLFGLGVERVSGQHLAQVGDAGRVQHVLVQNRGVVVALAEERRGSPVQAERHGRFSVRYEATEGLQGMEKAVRLREEVQVGMGTMERGGIEAPGGTALQHTGLVL